jgi:Cu2+-exporting ATPase
MSEPGHGYVDPPSVSARPDHAAHAGHDGHGAHAEMFRRRFWVSLILSVPVVVLSPMVADLLGYTLPGNPAVTWLPPIGDGDLLLRRHAVSHWWLG